MPGHNGFSRADSQLLSRAQGTSPRPGFVSAGSTCSSSFSLLRNRVLDLLARWSLTDVIRLIDDKLRIVV